MRYLFSRTHAHIPIFLAYWFGRQSMTPKIGNTAKTFRKLANRKPFTEEEDRIIMNANSDWKKVMQMLPGRTHASIACRKRRLLDQQNPSRTRLRNGMSLKAKRDETARKKLLKPANQTNGIYNSVSALTAFAIRNVIQQQKARDSASLWARSNRKKINKRKKKRRGEDQSWRIQENIRTRLADYVRSKGVLKSKCTEVLIQTKWNDLKIHLEDQLQENDTLEDKEVDHIFPMSMFDLQNEEEQLKCMHFSNFQPLTKKENTSKGDKLPTKAMALKVDPKYWPSGIRIEDLPEKYPMWKSALHYN